MKRIGVKDRREIMSGFIEYLRTWRAYYRQQYAAHKTEEFRQKLEGVRSALTMVEYYLKQLSTKARAK